MLMTALLIANGRMTKVEEGVLIVVQLKDPSSGDFVTC